VDRRHLARLLAATFVASLLVAVPIGRPIASTLAAATTTFCVEGLYSFTLQSFGAPGEVQTFRLTSLPTGFISFGASTAGPFSDPLDINVTMGSNGVGQVQFIARGEAVGETTLTARNTTTNITTNTLSVIVDKVDSIELEPVDPAHALDADPNGGGSGQRFFPDLDTPGADATGSRSLKIKATLELSSQDVRVDFRFADIDDPSSDASPVDANGSAGVDNRGAASLSALQAQTDQDGVATVEVRLPMQPGDNVRLLASCAAGYVNTLFIDGAGVKDQDDRTLPTPAAEISEPVTTWRRVWLETDSMGAVHDNFVEGTTASARETSTRINRTRTAVTKIALASMTDSFGNALGARTFARDQFRFGRIEVNGVAYDILGSNRLDIYIAPGNAAAVGSGFYFMVDDDNNNAQRNGDDGFDVPLPDLAHLQESDNQAANWYADAFIRPMHLPGHDELPFRLNGNDEPSAMFCKVLDDPCPAGQGSFDNVATEASAAYWTAYLLGAFQAIGGRDGDPDDENILGGKADAIGQGVVVYQESAREARGLGPVCEAAGIAAHELAHLFGGTHTTSGIMTEACVDATTGSSAPRFSAESLAQIRSAAHP
jgi:hypothetical protein